MRTVFFPPLLSPALSIQLQWTSWARADSEALLPSEQSRAEGNNAPAHHLSAVIRSGILSSNFFFFFFLYIFFVLFLFLFFVFSSEETCQDQVDHARQGGRNTVGCSCALEEKKNKRQCAPGIVRHIPKILFVRDTPPPPKHKHTHTQTHVVY